ncbi:NADPH-dependent glutamate synthase [Candidatus Bathyarchaeota archaeon]|nr:NADPH-dependent glutamate synthase [Candidatus Bathyarchaeota archaeon]
MASKPSEKLMKRMSVRRLPAEVRRHNFDEVSLGYNEEEAMTEAKRCLKCPSPFCIKGCPVQIEIPAFIECIRKGDFSGAISKLKEKNNLPGITGRVCPQELQCEEQCVLGKRGDPIAIGALERFAADYELKKGVGVPERAKSTGKRVAVIGSGPAGLTAAGDLAKLGHEVTVFEALHLPGGVLVYGIPEFRLPKSIVKAEVEYVSRLGAEIKTNVIIGRTLSVDDLFDQGYNAVFIGTGAGSPWFMRISGENLNRIYSANEFLTRCNLMKAYSFPEYDTPIQAGKGVAVVGGGNAAMDAARTALRLGGEEVHIIYRRSREEMPARLEEVRNAEEEGVQMDLLVNPTRYLGNKNGWVEGVECLRMELGTPDESGRRRPVPLKGSEFLMQIDLAVVAIGQGPNPLIAQTTQGLTVGEDERIVVDEFGKSSRGGVWAAGDIASNEGTVIHAMGNAKKSALAIHQYLMK